MARQLKRHVYRGTVEGAVLRVAAGRGVRMVDRKVGDVIGDSYEQGVRARFELGDQIMIAPWDINREEMALVEVAGMTSNADPWLRVLRGELATGAVVVLPAKRARAPRSKPRKTVTMPGVSLAERVRAVRDRAIGGTP